jgi:acyl-CoA synthetase (AMP-forming)/AMP-acid ligase II
MPCVAAGQLIPGIVARVVKPDGTLAGYDEPGELMIKSPSMALCYANNPEAYVSPCHQPPDRHCDISIHHRTRETFVDGSMKFRRSYGILYAT